MSNKTNLSYMKYLLIIFLFNSTFLFSQKPNKRDTIYLNDLIVQTIDIMNELKIEFRKNYVRDSAIEFIVNKNLLAFNAYFKGKGGKLKYSYPQNDLRLRFYSNPCIVISSSLDSVLMGKKDTSNIVYHKALSTIVHELTHYLQVTMNIFHPQSYIPTKFTRYTLDKMMSDPIEVEGYSVGAYFYLRKYYPIELAEIMESSQSTKTKIRLLINAFYKAVYPWRPVPFLKP